MTRFTQGVPMQRQFLLVGRTAIAAAMLVLVAPIAALAGGAEPLRIEFKRGAYGTTISDSVRGDEEAEYVLGAKGGSAIDHQADFHAGQIFRIRIFRRG
jgi:hypothetical protein